MRVGAAFVPLKPACMPKAVLPAGAMTLLYGMLRAVTDVPLDVTAAFQALLMTWLPDQVQVTFQVLVATVPGLLTVTVAVKPLPH